MRKLKAWVYITLDGVVEAPEKWVMPNEAMFAEQTAGYAESDALLLGRRTCGIFAASWPRRGSGSATQLRSLLIAKSHAYDNGVVSLNYQPPNR